ncbi:hypothetical protein D7X94_10050 [Acutalibacter sp. 1XD8-33]|uniref:hypothetical protein n=1 Tax=Acutalibacter sp. 1XD8-33 TaxID=2320081 RepID=UPI000EA3167D|nr:hypothetical protein [Acutalibacter sp. 1XD8-33]RKJ39960.1 hypothetical protein D7X94_10050 [Acutalibacter sp. 1XD8-33]
MRKKDGRNKTQELRPEIDYREHEMPDQEAFPDISNVASANECTGLMYRSPVDGAERESYKELSSMAIPKEEPEEEV